MPWFVSTFRNRLCWFRMRPPRTPVIRSADGLDDRGVFSTAAARAESGLARAAPPRVPAAVSVRNERRECRFAMEPSSVSALPKEPGLYPRRVDYGVPSPLGHGLIGLALHAVTARD